MESDANQNLDSHLARFGLTSFRPGQQDVISAVLAGRDCLCIMPTGGGKSLCYQLPGVVRPGVALVVSPLIALMKDQVDALLSQGIRATYINSSLPFQEQRERLAGLADGQYDLVYVAPERLRNPLFLESVRDVPLQLLAVDEAHCISEWGHDFRPDYARLGQFRERLGNLQTIALTATATPDVRKDVAKQLGLRDPQIVVTGFARPNLRFEVHSPANTREKDELLLSLVNETPGRGIIYAATRRRCEEICERLGGQLRRTVGLYHAGLLPEDRRKAQERFMRGDVEIIVATVAFGMGIDKADLRFVLHYNLPGSLEAYYQEAGRAGRDGQPSRCALLFSYADRFLQEFFIGNAYPSRAVVKTVYDFLRKSQDDPIEMTLQEIKELLDLPVGSEGVGVCERLLEKCGALERMDARQNMASVKLETEFPTLVEMLPKEARVQRKVLRAAEHEIGDRRYEWVYFSPQKLASKLELEPNALNRALRELLKLPDFDFVPPFRGRAIHMIRRERPFQELDIDFEELERRKQAELAKLDRVIRYAQTHRCRQVEILDYFGDRQGERCQACDNCRPDTENTGSSYVDSDGDDQAVLEAIRITLSGVARAKGRVGKHLLAKMLCGSRSAQVTRLQLHRLSTFGLLKELKQTEMIQLIDALLHAGLLEQIETQRHRPIVQLTENGNLVMRGKSSLETPIRLDLGVKMKLLARYLACGGKKGKSTRSRHEPPQDAVPGSAEPASARLDEAEAEHAETEPQSPLETQPQVNHVPAGDSAGPADGQAQQRPNHYWTWRLLSDHYDLQQCAQIRCLDEATLLDHLHRAADEGMPVNPRWFLSPEQLDLLHRTIGPTPPRQLRPILEELPPGFRREQVELFLKCRSS
ncbi:MAG: RecQ family ATP-dependent DNA helicase [Pirellulaceae bacterium]